MKDPVTLLISASYSTLSRLAGDIDKTLVLLNNTINRGQAKAGSLTDFFGGEKGFEDPGHR